MQKRPRQRRQEKKVQKYKKRKQTNNNDLGIANRWLSGYSYSLEVDSNLKSILLDKIIKINIVI